MKELLVSNVEEVEEVEGYQVDPKAACDKDCLWLPNSAVYTTEH